MKLILKKSCEYILNSSQRKAVIAYNIHSKEKLWLHIKLILKKSCDYILNSF